MIPPATDAADGAAIRRLEQRANRMDLVSRWADDLAHEIKNPLHAMVINLELVKRKAGEPGPVVQRAGIVEAELHRVHALVESLLRLVRPWPDYPFSDVDDVFEHLLPVIRARARIRKVGYDHHPGGGRVAMPPGDLAQVLLNLIDRAIEAAPAGAAFATRCTAGDEHVRVVVTGARRPSGDDAADRGAGGGGAGAGEDLGLAVTRRLVRAAGGELALGPAEGGADDERAARLILPRAGSA